MRRHPGPGSTASARGRRRSVPTTPARVVVLLAAWAGLASCGLPDEGRTEVVPDASVPYDLLDAGDPGSATPPDSSTVPRGVPVVFWLGPDDRLTPASADLSCDATSEQVVRGLLDDLASAPSDAQREQGLSSVIPPAASLALVGIEDGAARVSLDPLALGDAERLPLAVGQVVLTVTSAPGVDTVALVTSSETVDLPLPDGTLAPGAAGADDYAVLLPPRLAPDGLVSPDIGCR